METANVAAIPAKLKPTRLRPDHVERLREAKFDLQARYRVETDENRILEQFFEERFEQWIAEKLAGRPAADAPSGKAKR